MTREQRYICELQQKIFGQACLQNAVVCDFAVEFMNSDFCNRSLDNDYSVDQFADIVNWFEFLELEGIWPHPDLLQDNPVPQEVAGWMGFIYRHLYFATEIHSNELVKKITPQDLITLYSGLHTFDEDMAIEIICENHGLTLVDGWDCQEPLSC